VATVLGAVAVAGHRRCPSRTRGPCSALGTVEEAVVAAREGAHPVSVQAEEVLSAAGRGIRMVAVRLALAVRRPVGTLEGRVHKAGGAVEGVTLRTEVGDGAALEAVQVAAAS